MSEVIKFHFQPYEIESGAHAVEKDDNGSKRRYLYGVSSGVSIDGHGERMTPECIKDFMEQGSKGDILLYPDLHGVRGTDDIGIMTKAELKPNGDWFTEYRLYDEADNMGSTTMERADKAWRQINGLPPYTKARQKGFSIEGRIPDNGIVAMSDGGKRVINKVELDGVVLVPRPAYKTSIAHAVYKALGELTPWQVQKGIASRLREGLAMDEMRDSYYRKRCKVQNALDGEIENIMRGDEQERAEQLDILFDEYKSLMIELLLQSADLFKIDLNTLVEEGGAIAKGFNRYDVLKSAETLLLNMIEKRKIKGA